MTFHTKDRQQAVGLLYCAHASFTKALRMPEIRGGQRIFLEAYFGYVERKITAVQRRRLGIFRTLRLL